MSDNPLNKYFRRPALWIKLPTGGRWYNNGEVSLNEQGEVQIYGLSAIDDIMLNTPDALLNGHALRSVIKNCVPDVKDVHRLLQPDLDAIYLGIKAATNNGKFDLDRKCPQCKHENHFEVNCMHLIDSMSFVDDSDTMITVDQLRIHVRPYDFDMRSVLLHKQFEEQRVLNQIDKETEQNDEFSRAEAVAISIERLSRLTFKLVAETITCVEVMDGSNVTVTDPNYINEWLTNIDKNTADAVISAVNDLNLIGPPKEIPITCQSCNHTWKEQMSFDPVLFFGR